jgi:lipopolysaccharide transport system ATP-binding protein
MTDIAIRVQNLSKCYHLYDTPRDRLKQFVVPKLCRAFPPLRKVSSIPHSLVPTYYREFWALKDISFEIKKGETVGIIGRNGSGKSTLLQILAGTLAPTSGEANINGRIAALLELGSGFNPEFTGHENVILNGQILGLSQKEIEARYDQIVEFADIGEFIDQPLKTYSSGMFVRLAFAVQAHIDASIVIIDEALAVGDIFFRQKCYARLEQLRNSGAAILLVSHAMPDIEQYCKRAILLDHGTQRFIGPASEATKHYYLLHQTGRSKVPSQASVPANESREPLGNHVIHRPPVEAFLDLSGKAQVSNGQARCTGVALCNASGEPCNAFRQGDKAVFHYEFELSNDIGMPICGVVISNDRGVIVHGKNSWQYDDEAPLRLGSGSKLICQQEIQLGLGPGEYTFEVGLACVSMTDWKNREYISHEEFSIRHERLCHIYNVGQFSVGLALKGGLAVLTHHGVADLQGKITMASR